MKKTLLIVAISIAVLLAGFLTFVATRPADYQVSRSKVIAATPEQLAPLMTDLKLWSTWNPWDELDPGMTKEYTDPSSGVGAYYTWSGNADVGKGKMAITKVEPLQIQYHLTFIEPFASEADIAIIMTPESNGSGTKVEWRMTGKNDFMGKLFGTFMDFDGMIGKDFEKGLDKLATKVAAGS